MEASHKQVKPMSPSDICLLQEPYGVTWSMMTHFSQGFVNHNHRASF